MKFKILLLTALLIIPFSNKAEAEIELSQAEAIFIYNFLSHIQWPEESLGSKYVVGVYGRTSTFDYLSKLTNNRTVGTRSIEVRQFVSEKDFTNCQVLLVSNSKSNEIGTIEQRYKGKGCLIVGQKSNLTESGAAIAFKVVDGKLRYSINETNAKEQNLLISSALLQMALK